MSNLIKLQNGLFNEKENILFINGYRITPTKILKNVAIDEVHNYLQKNTDEGVIDQNEEYILFAKLDDKGVKYDC